MLADLLLTVAPVGSNDTLAGNGGGVRFSGQLGSRSFSMSATFISVRRPIRTHGSLPVAIKFQTFDGETPIAAADFADAEREAAVVLVGEMVEQPSCFASADVSSTGGGRRSCLCHLGSSVAAVEGPHWSTVDTRLGGARRSAELVREVSAAGAASRPSRTWLRTAAASRARGKVCVASTRPRSSQPPHFA